MQSGLFQRTKIIAQKLGLSLEFSIKKILTNIGQINVVHINTDLFFHFWNSTFICNISSLWNHSGKRAAYELNFTRLGEKGAQRTESLAQEKS